MHLIHEEKKTEKKPLLLNLNKILEFSYSTDNKLTEIGTKAHNLIPLFFYILRQYTHIKTYTK